MEKKEIKDWGETEMLEFLKKDGLEEWKKRFQGWFLGLICNFGELARALSSKQPELGINKRDILCVEIAGLCHDLGHGPFSHLYDGIFIPKAYAKHEDASLLMFDHLVKDNGLKPLMKLYGLDPYGNEENDLKFITEMIQGKPLTEAQVEASWPYEGRKEEKSFLYEIVANKLNGIDVDKFDYLARDAYHLGMQSNFDHKRFIMLARVCEVNGRKRICSRDKEVGNLYDMFHTRNCLHRRVCQHKTHKSIEIMISEAFLEADEHIEIEGSGGKFKLSEAKDDMEAYTKLTDQVFETILHPWSSSPKLEKARKILERIVSRNLYKFVGETKVCSKVLMSLYYIWFVMAGDHLVTFDYGKKDEDPIKNTYFYSKDEPTKGFKISDNQKSKLIPTTFSEKIIRVYCKNAEKVNKDVRDAFKDWCKEKKYLAEPQVIFRYSMLKVQCVSILWYLVMRLQSATNS
uniref:Deoxynucleoside triphosphate triphosphohydrolase SAMHD1-like n=1 Tax=Acanthochromis polyacanthus TaxID=80966 RepID=A0A3Q1GMH3_9TELE